MEKKSKKGVLVYNSKTRDEMLMRNGGKYSLYQGSMSPAIGENYNIDFDRDIYSLTNGKDLLEYTSNKDDVYGSMISKQYLNDGKDRESYPNDGSVDLEEYYHSKDSVVGEFINKQYFPSGGTFSSYPNDGSINLEEYYHGKDSVIGEFINKQYFPDNRGDYSMEDGTLLDDTHNAGTEYSKDINHKYIDNRGDYSMEDGTLLDDTHNAGTEYSKDINHKYIDNRGDYSMEDGTLLDDTHNAGTEYSKDINHKYIDNRGDYSMEDGTLLDDTHNAGTEYSKDINHKYIDNRGDYSMEDGTLLDDTHNAGTEYSKDINHKYIDNRGDYSMEDGTLLDDTHGNSSDYSKSIDNKYFPNGLKELYDATITNDLINKVEDYAEYIGTIRGEDIYSRHVSYLNRLLANTYIENGLIENEVGVIRNPNVGFALNNVITTNQNNFSGKDTPLGVIGNSLYARMLYNGAIFNSSRHSEVKYLTPHLINVYGNNQSNVYRLSDLLNVGDDTYRMRENPGKDVKISEFSDSIYDLNTGYLLDNIENAKGLSKSELSVNDNSYDYNENIDKSSVPITNQINNEKKTLGTYTEGDVSNGINSIEQEDDQWNTYKSVESGLLKGNNILYKTSSLFREHAIKTMISRFHTSSDISKESEFIDTAKSRYGNSHGRNLLTKEAETSETGVNTNGYDNPYCRTWTYHHQYNQIKDLIRPFGSETSENNAMTISDIQGKLHKYRSSFVDENGNEILNGGEYLSENTVLNSNNGKVNIAPSSTDSENSVEIKKCMFSIENLAWKDITEVQKKKYISKEQIGPNGGRIMWFPPYDLDFQENVNVNWQPSDFIGRGESVYTYANTRRTGSLSFSLLIDHPSIVNSFTKDDNVTNNDILRFFAGCSIPEIDKKIEKEEETVVEIKEEEPQTEEGEIKFSVYFPNNFTGYNPYNKKSTDDWWIYLLFGNRCSDVYSITTDKDSTSRWNGYEMTTIGISKTTIENSDTMKSSITNGLMGISKNAYNGNSQKDIDNPNSIEEETEVKNGGHVEKDLYQDFSRYCYHYRVDNDLRQKLCSGKGICENYFDNTSYQLNSKTKSGENEYSFAEIIYSLILSKKINSIYVNDYVISDFFKPFFVNKCNISEEKSKQLSEKFKDEKFKINGIEIKGSATSSDSKHSVMLAKRRANSVKSLFTSDTNLNIEQNNITTDGKREEFANGQKNESISSLNNKKQRCVSVTLKYNISETNLLSETSANATNKKDSDNTGSEVTLEENNKAVQQDTETKAKEETIDSILVYDSDDEKTRYETESEYFSKLKYTDPLIFKGIKDKFKYFDPAYHSISPEGFNARLTFLQQCTRQGMTLESGSFTSNSPAGNLNFGRMPVCVIRIGDFINTRAIIDSMNISYSNGSGMLWDLNPEGIGVQPMYAKITLNVVLIGGQSLSGPVSRLQNAVSFNYYANTGVYDDRSDIVENGKYKRINTMLNEIGDDIRTGSAEIQKVSKK